MLAVLLWPVALIFVIVQLLRGVLNQPRTRHKYPPPPTTEAIMAMLHAPPEPSLSLKPDEPLLIDRCASQPGIAQPPPAPLQTDPPAVSAPVVLTHTYVHSTTSKSTYIGSSSFSGGTTYVRGHIRKNGSYVNGHVRRTTRGWRYTRPRW